MYYIINPLTWPFTVIPNLPQNLIEVIDSPIPLLIGLLGNKKLAEEIKLKCIIFPQDSLLGSSIKDVIKRHTIVKKDSINWLRELAKLTKNTIAIIGDIAHINDEYINTPIVLHNGKINTDFKNQYFIIYQILNLNNITK